MVLHLPCPLFIDLLPGGRGNQEQTVHTHFRVQSLIRGRFVCTQYNAHNAHNAHNIMSKGHLSLVQRKSVHTHIYMYESVKEYMMVGLGYEIYFQE